MGRKKYHNSEMPMEGVLEEIKNELKDKNVHFDFIHAAANDYLDVRGIDFLIFHKDYEIIPIQLKSSFSEGKVQKHFGRYKVPLIFIESTNDETLKFVIYDLLAEWGKNKKIALFLVYATKEKDVQKYNYKSQ